MKNILLIGGSTGIGEELLKLLKDKGYSTTVLCRTASNDTIFCDVTDLETPLPEIEGTFDGFVYLPGSINLKPFKQLSMEEFEIDMKINYFSAVRTVKKYLPLLEKGKDPSMVFISSVAATTGMSYHTSIGAAKAAVEGFALALSAEIAPKIRVNTVAPSLTKTPLAQKLVDTEEKENHSKQKHPLQKIGEPKDIASMILFLLSDDARWITGQTFHVDGGFSSLRFV